jgi:[NiFe] hydrogenase diaphorase moiety large subunit
MSATLASAVKGICKDLGNDRSRMMDIVRAVQDQFGCVDSEAQHLIAKATGATRVEVEGTVSFYSFLSKEKKGDVVIRLCDDVIDEMKGSGRVAQALKETLGIDFGETTPDGKISLEWTPCIGMCDQAPAALVNDIPVVDLGADIAREGVTKLMEHLDPQKLVRRYGDGNNSHDLVRAPVHNHIRQRGEVLFSETVPGAAMLNALAMTPVEVIRHVKTSRLRGRGGAGFPTGMKWDFTRGAEGEQKYLVCNADEGEPGTFKDRVLLTETPDLLFEGMTIAGYAIGATEGIVYLRAEYAYLKEFLENVLQQRRDRGWLGKSVMRQEGFDFDIRIQLGAGAYVCGEETALISSCEGLRGDPKNRPPFPAQKGYLGCPTSVNNVETLCCVTRILENGPGWFSALGSEGSAGTKLISVSGDCNRPGVYEVPFGTTLREFFALCGAQEIMAAQVGGPSGQLVGEADFDRQLCYDDLATGGSLMVFNHERDILHIVKKFLDFFVEESCGYCTPCRVGNRLLLERVQRVIDGLAETSDLDYLESLGQSIKVASRCGLGQTSPNPVLSSIKNFRDAYEAKLQEPVDGKQPGFDIQAQLTDAVAVTGRESVHFKG